MAKYIVQWDYKSNDGGPWNEGDVVELAPEPANICNRGSPGVLVLESDLLKPEPKPEPRPTNKPALLIAPFTKHQAETSRREWAEHIKNKVTITYQCFVNSY